MCLHVHGTFTHLQAHPSSFDSTYLGNSMVALNGQLVNLGTGSGSAGTQECVRHCFSIA